MLLIQVGVSAKSGIGMGIKLHVVVEDRSFVSDEASFEGVEFCRGEVSSGMVNELAEGHTDAAIAWVVDIHQISLQVTQVRKASFKENQTDLVGHPHRESDMGVIIIKIDDLSFFVHRMVLATGLLTSAKEHLIGVGREGKLRLVGISAKVLNIISSKGCFGVLELASQQCTSAV